MTHQRFINEQPCSSRRNGAIHSFFEKSQSWSRRDWLKIYWLEYASDFLAFFSAHTDEDELSWVGISTSQSLQRSETILFSKARSLLVPSSVIYIQARIQFLRRSVDLSAYVSLSFQSHLESLRHRRSFSLFRFHVQEPVLRIKSSNLSRLTSLKMRLRDSIERNENAHSNERGKSKAKTTRSLFSTSLRDLT